MNFYLKLLIKILERSMTAKDSEILKKLKSGYDLSSEEKKELEELIEIQDSRILEQGDLLRVTLERERKLTRIKNKQDVLIRSQKELILKYKLMIKDYQDKERNVRF